MRCPLCGGWLDSRSNELAYLGHTGDCILQRGVRALERIAAALERALPIAIPPDELRCPNHWIAADNTARCVLRSNHKGDCEWSNPKPVSP